MPSLNDYITRNSRIGLKVAAFVCLTTVFLFLYSSNIIESVGISWKVTKVRVRENNSPYPDAILIGVLKSGTFALKKFLSLHPDIVVAGQEMNFFNREYYKGLDYYLQQLPNRTRADQVLIEKSPSYFRSQRVPQRMLKMRPDLRVLLIVREPVERMVSQYLHFDKRRDQTAKSFAVSIRMTYQVLLHVLWPVSSTES